MPRVHDDSSSQFSDESSTARRRSAPRTKPNELLHPSYMKADMVNPDQPDLLFMLSCAELANWAYAGMEKGGTVEQLKQNALDSGYSSVILIKDRASSAVLKTANDKSDIHSRGKPRVAIVADDEKIVVSFRGTGDGNDAMTDAKFFQQPRQDSEPWLAGTPGIEEQKYHSGFSDLLFSKSHQSTHHLQAQVTRALRQLVKENPKRKIYFVGHSLGGAMAEISAKSLADQYPKTAKRIAGVVTFGAPKIGNQAYVDSYNTQLKNKTIRVRNKYDPVPSMPPASKGMGWYHPAEGNSLEVSADGQAAMKATTKAAAAGGLELDLKNRVDPKNHSCDQYVGRLAYAAAKAQPELLKDARFNSHFLHGKSKHHHHRLQNLQEDNSSSSSRSSSHSSSYSSSRSFSHSSSRSSSRSRSLSW